MQIVRQTQQQQQQIGGPQYPVFTGPYPGHPNASGGFSNQGYQPNISYLAPPDQPIHIVTDSGGFMGAPPAYTAVYPNGPSQEAPKF